MFPIARRAHTWSFELHLRSPFTSQLCKPEIEIWNKSCSWVDLLPMAFVLIDAKEVALMFGLFITRILHWLPSGSNWIFECFFPAEDLYSLYCHRKWIYIYIAMENYQRKSKDRFYRRSIEHILCPTLSWKIQWSKSILFKLSRLLTFHTGPSAQRWLSSFLNLALCRQYRGPCRESKWALWGIIERIRTSQKTNLSHPFRDLVLSQWVLNKLALIGWPAHFNSSTINQCNSENFMVIKFIVVSVQN